MEPMAPEEETEQIEVRLVLEAIHAKYGYDFRDYSPPSISRRVKAALAKSGSAHLGELLHRLLIEPQFFAGIVDQLTIQASDMFRDPAFYRTFGERVLPVLRTYPTLKIWHAGCASGEEVYTAILLAEADLYERTQIYATDISLRALDQAKEGVYAAARAEGFASNYASAGGKRRFEDYCSSRYEHIVVKEALRKNIVFFQHDLSNDYALGEMHVIFCRNVLLYFGDALRERVLPMLARGLYRGGFLCLGESESLPASQTSTFAAFAAADRIYRRRGES
jgi:chemotaxis protein methyltransferase CheR